MRGMKYSTLITYILSLTFLACSGHSETPAATRFTIPTVYYLPVLKIEPLECTPADAVTLRTNAGKSIAKVCRAQRKRCTLQGSCYVQSKTETKLLNVDDVVNGERRFILVDMNRCPYGLGSRSNCLDPFYTIAADNSIYPVKTVIYIEKVRGLKLPDGEAHTGYFVVRDSGGAIKGRDRFDFFTGTLFRDPENPFIHLGLADRNTRLEYSVAPADVAAEVLKERAYPELKDSVKDEAQSIFGI